MSCHTFWMDSDLYFFFLFFFLFFSPAWSQYIYYLNHQCYNMHDIYAVLSNKHEPCFLLVWYLCTVSKKTELSIGESTPLTLPHSHNTRYYRLCPQSKTNKSKLQTVPIPTKFNYSHSCSGKINLQHVFVVTYWIVRLARNLFIISRPTHYSDLTPAPHPQNNKVTIKFNGSVDTPQLQYFALK